MRIFLVKHPIISLVMVGLICSTVVSTTEIIVNGKKSKISLFKKNNTQEEVESVEE